MTRWILEIKYTSENIFKRNHLSLTHVALVTLPSISPVVAMYSYLYSTYLGFSRHMRTFQMEAKHCNNPGRYKTKTKQC